ncbi:unnamed protein product [Effrenium voratum]|uniref:Ribonuclease n=1 Tax=Effrenium voratum TaxID=2562239 RepID=A0AA36MYV8_9DINO|nr:unnamed protein product [Effrenium voratum]
MGWAVSVVGVAGIDKNNILEAAHKAMAGAVRNLRRDLRKQKEDPVGPVVVDGNLVPKRLGTEQRRLQLPCRALVGGDRLCFEIAAASVLAKVTRDRLMVRMDRAYPSYGFAAHKGYGTAAHQAALKRLGPCAEHRKSFEPVKTFLASGKWQSRAKRLKR